MTNHILTIAGHGHGTVDSMKAEAEQRGAAVFTFLIFDESDFTRFEDFLNDTNFETLTAVIVDGFAHLSEKDSYNLLSRFSEWNATHLEFPVTFYWPLITSDAHRAVRVALSFADLINLG